jgi:hypothetical protein
MAAVGAATLALLALAGVARADSVTSLAFFGPGRPISETDIPAAVSGEVGVVFHADPATGCAALGACAYRGTEAWRPGSGGTLGLLTFEQGGRIHTLADLALGQGSSGPNSLIAAGVQRVAAGVVQGSCGDEQSGLADISGEARSGSIGLSLSNELSSLRCAGPLAADLAKVTPSVRVGAQRLGHGRIMLDFRANRPFAAHGFAGTLTSTLVVTLGRPHTQRRTSAPTFPRGIPTRRTRIVSETITVTRSAGRVTATVSGSRNADLCALLDSCGLTGTLMMAPVPGPSQGELTAIGPATRPYVDFLAALGVSRAGRSQGLQVAGGVNWTDRGSMSASFSQSDSCSDSAPLGQGAAALGLAGKVFTVGYAAGGAGPFSGASPRTRCPGPMLAQFPSLISGRVPRSRFAQRRFTVSLRSHRTFSDQGYEVSVAGPLALTFRRGRVHQQIVTLPAG